jgi:hypothetical protein
MGTLGVQDCGSRGSNRKGGVGSLGVGPSGSPEGVAQHPVLISRAVYAG